MRQNEYKKNKMNLRNVLKKFLPRCQRKPENEEPSDEYLSPEFRQVILALGPLLLTIGFGMIMGYSATLIPQLQEKNSTVPEIDENQASWIASIAALPMAIGCIIGGFLVEHFGRKTTHLMTCLPTLVGWLMIYLASGIELILIGRFITGFCCGILGSATGIYIGETSSPSIRGFLLAAISFSIAKGLFLVHIIGTFTHWRTTALISCAVPILSVILLLFVPESPAWLVKKGRIEHAEEAFYWCRGNSEDARKELGMLLEKRPKESDSQESKLEICKGYFVPEFLKPLAVIVVFIVANQWAGVSAIAFYTVSILRDTFNKSFDEYLAMLIIDFIRVQASVLACVLLRKFGRRPLAVISGGGTTLSLLILSGFTYLTSLYPILNTHTYIPIIALVSYISFIQIGFVPLPWAMIGEVFPLKHRSTGSAVSTFMGLMASFSVVKTGPGMFMVLGSHGAFFVYALVALAGTIFVFAYLPETKDKTLHEIEDNFKRKPKKTVRDKYDDDENFA